ncbi:MAG: hypothetical protein ACPGSO_00735 [Vicingaceae bacterium]
MSRNLEVKCVCVNDKNKPIKIDESRWVKKDNEYSITHIYYHPNQGIQGVELKEVKLLEKDAPFEAYRLDRFGIYIDQLDKLKELIKLCTDLNDFDIEELIKKEVYADT